MNEIQEKGSKRARILSAKCLLAPELETVDSRELSWEDSLNFHRSQEFATHPINKYDSSDEITRVQWKRIRTRAERQTLSGQHFERERSKCPQKSQNVEIKFRRGPAWAPTSSVLFILSESFSTFNFIHQITFQHYSPHFDFSSFSIRKKSRSTPCQPSRVVSDVLTDKIRKINCM